MLDTYVTVVGNLVADPRLMETAGRPAMASFRLASTPRRFDRGAGEWRDGETLFTNVTCWRGLAENVTLSLKKGQSVIVHGRLMKRGYETKTGEHRESVDIDALAVGPELSRVAAVVKRVERSTAATPPDSALAGHQGAGAQTASEEFDVALPAVEDDPELERAVEVDAAGEDFSEDYSGEDGGGDEAGDDLELADAPELAGAGAGSGGRRRSRFGIG
ncbi:MAG TPA: single-stranded DNA-binding protein [Acidothermaceae bacterium]|jgi:single-strand DNA-binding protein